MKTQLISLLLKAASLLPLAASRRVGRSLAYLAWLLGGSPRRVTERNIALAFPELSETQQRYLARRSLLATGELAGEMGFVWNRPWETVRGTIKEVIGDQAVEQALAAGHGVVVLGPHLGNWEVAGLYLSSFGDALALYEPPHMQALEKMVRDARERSGTSLVPTDARGLATLVRTLKRGGVTGILPDQVPPVVESGENSMFMGISCFTMTFASKLLQRSGARAFYAFAERISGGFRLHFVAADEAIYSTDLAESLKALNDGVERCLRVCPAQYQWEYKRFRERPRGAVDVYAKGYQLTDQGGSKSTGTGGAAS
ncbi:MAG: lysophospholipid acyltransferase family protein [Pseudomonadota bacterium]